MASLALFNHVAMAFPAPMADDLLLRWDRALGLNWVAYAHLIGDIDIVSFILDHIYQAMLPALIIVGLHAVFIGHSSKCNELLALVITTGIFSVFIAAFFPAMGPMDYIHDTNVMALFAKNEISGFLPQLIELRTAPHIALNPLRLAGLAQFPSYHCACGIYTIYGSRGSYYSLVPATIFSILMIAATPIIGDHYFVDLIAGACVAIAFILAGRKLYQNSVAKG